MTGMVAQLERARRARTRWSMATSVALHAGILIGLFMMKAPRTERAPITEVTWLEPGDLGGGSAAPAAREALRARPGVAVRARAEEHFQRAVTPAEVAPSPQSDVAFSDRLASRLATLARTTESSPATSGTGRVAVSAGMWGGTAPSRAGGDGGGRVALTRGGGLGSGPAVALTRGSGLGSGSSNLVRAAAAPERVTSAPADAGDANARRTLAGAQLIGPVADRAIVRYIKPEYPEWAKRDAVEGAVTLYFVVRSDGTVKENVLVQKTAGFADFDESARAALRTWRFEPLSGGRTGEQWGTITFHFRLAGGG